MDEFDFEEESPGSTSIVRKRSAQSHKVVKNGSSSVKLTRIDTKPHGVPKRKLRLPFGSALDTFSEKEEVKDSKQDIHSRSHTNLDQNNMSAMKAPNSILGKTCTPSSSVTGDCESELSVTTGRFGLTNRTTIQMGQSTHPKPSLLIQPARKSFTFSTPSEGDPSSPSSFLTSNLSDQQRHELSVQKDHFHDIAPSSSLQSSDSTSNAKKSLSSTVLSRWRPAK